MNLEQQYGGHSAQVTMRLILNGTSIRITHMGRDFVILESARDYPPSEATIFFKVDERERQRKVKMPNGISKHSNRVTLALCEVANEDRLAAG